MLDFLAWIRQALELELLQKHHPVLQWILKVCRFFTQVGIEFYQERCFYMASTLSFSSAFAIVPVSTVYFSVFNAFPDFNNLVLKAREGFLLQMVPESHMRNEVVKYLNELTSNVYSLTAISIATVFVTSILLFITVEDSLNKIFAVRLTPAWQRSVLTFTGLFFWGPTLMGLSSFLWIRGLTFAAFSSMTGTQWGHSLITFAVSWLLFVASYYFLPYGNTSLRSSILGGFVGASLWECAKWLFGLYLQEAFVYSRVYGSVAFIPLSLLWIYVSWVIFLFGATVSFCYQFRDMLDMLGSDAEHDPILLTQATLASLMVIARRFRSGDPPVTIYDLSQLIKAPSHLIQSGLLALAEKRILHPINRKCDTFLPARSLENVSMMDAFWATFPKTPNLRGALAEIELAGELMNHARDAMQAVLSNQTLAQFLENPRLSAK